MALKVDQKTSNLERAKNLVASARNLDELKNAVLILADVIVDVKTEQESDNVVRTTEVKSER